MVNYNSVGIIPGPNESKEAFYKRATYCLNLKDTIPEMLGHEFSFTQKEEKLAADILEDGCGLAQQLYGIYPAWVPLFFSDYKLSFWQGGCAWIFQQTQDSPTAAFFQLRQKFRHSERYLGLYDREELISHELSHVGRMMFEEPKFEEILAYRSSKSAFRRFWGPIVQSSLESTLFVLVLFSLILIDLMTILGGYDYFSYLSYGIRLIVIGMIAFACLRLWKRQKQFKRCYEKLMKIFSEDQAHAIIYRLKDDEIMHFGNLTPEQIFSYATEQKSQSFRWELLHEIYFRGSKP